MTVQMLARAIPPLREVMCDSKGHAAEELIVIVCGRFESTEEVE